VASLIWWLFINF